MKPNNINLFIASSVSAANRAEMRHSPRVALNHSLIAGV
jgi:hypothetical protein